MAAGRPMGPTAGKGSASRDQGRNIIMLITIHIGARLLDNKWAATEPINEAKVSLQNSCAQVPWTLVTTTDHCVLAVRSNMLPFEEHWQNHLRSSGRKRSWKRGI